MKTSRHLSAAALAAVPLVSSNASAYEPSSTPITQAGFVQPHGGHSVVIPPSSVEHPTDVGVAVHTHVRFVVPTVAFGAPNKHPSLALTAAEARAMTSGAPSTIRASTTTGLPPVLGFWAETPASLACLHGLATKTLGCNPNTVTKVSIGGSKAVAIVIAYDDPTAFSDLMTYSGQFGLPLPTPSTFQVVYAAGAKPAYDASWAGEAALDTQMVHAMAPNAKIYLVEAATNRLSDLMVAVDKASSLVAAAGGGEVTMSWGSSEFFGQNTYDSHFTTSGIVYFASSGDTPTVNYPSSSPNVVAVGGMSYSRNTTTFNFQQFDSWTAAGSGVSLYSPIPPAQAAAAAVVGATKRVTPDISAVANPDTGVWIQVGGQWGVAGGTSVASPLTAGIVNASGRFAESTAAELATIYGAKATNANAFGTAVTGYCGRAATYEVPLGSQQAQFNLCTGVGTPIGTSTQ